MYIYTQSVLLAILALRNLDNLDQNIEHLSIAVCRMRLRIFTRVKYPGPSSNPADPEFWLRMRVASYAL